MFLLPSDIRVSLCYSIVYSYWSYYNIVCGWRD